MMSVMRNSVTTALLFGLAFAMGGAPACPAAEPAQEPPDNREPIEIVSGSYIYEVTGNTVAVRADEAGSATVNMGENSITADFILYEENKHLLNASGGVRIWNQGFILQGEFLVYYLDRDEGILEKVKQAEISEGVYFTGDAMVMRRIPAAVPKSATVAETRTEYTLYHGTVTGCDFPDPHYIMKYDRLVVRPDDRLWAYDMFFMAGSWPLMYFPFFSESLKTHEIAYIVYASHYNKLGYGLYNQLRIATSEQYTVNLYADYFSKAGVGEGGKVTFDIPGEYGPKGEFYGYHIKQEAPTYNAIYDGKDRYLVSGTYGQDLPYDMRVSARGHRFSDSQYYWDYYNPERVRKNDLNGIERDEVSFLSLSKYWQDQSLRITAAGRLDPFYYSGLPFVEREPQIHFENYPANLFDTDLFAALQLDYGRYRREEGTTYPLDYYRMYTQTNFMDEFDRYDAELVLSYPVHLPARITLKPWVGYRGTHYADPVRRADDPTISGFRLDRFEFDSVTRSLWEGGLELSTRETYEFDPFLKRYDRMRLVVEPILSYGYYNPDHALEELSSGPGVRFPYVDPVDDLRYEMHQVSALLRTRIQGKNHEGATGDFARLTVGTAYEEMPNRNLRFDSFEYFDDPAKHANYRYTDMIEDFSIYPYEWLSFGNSLRYDIDDGRIRSSYYYSNLTPIKGLNVSLGYNTYLYPFLNAQEQREAALHLLWDVNKKWQLYYVSRYDLEQNTIRQNYVGVMRDMHDFYAIFQVEYRKHPTLGKDLSFNFGFQFWGLGGRKGKSQPLRY